MTIIGKRTGSAIADHLPKTMARKVKKTLRSNSDNRSRYSEQNQQGQDISSEQIEVLLNATKPEETSTWRIGLHKRIVHNL